MISVAQIFLLKSRLTFTTTCSVAPLGRLSNRHVEINMAKLHSPSSTPPLTCSLCSLSYLSKFPLPLSSWAGQKPGIHPRFQSLSHFPYPIHQDILLALPSNCIHALCSFIRQSVSHGHKNRHRSGSGKQALISSQALETGGRAGHPGPCKGHNVWVRGRKTGKRGKSRPEPLLGFLQEQQGKVGQGKQFRIGYLE